MGSKQGSKCMMKSPCSAMLSLGFSYVVVVCITNIAVLKVIWRRCRRFYYLLPHYMIIASMAVSNILLAVAVLIAMLVNMQSSDHPGQIGGPSALAKSLTAMLLASLILPMMNAALLTVNRYILCINGIKYPLIVTKRKILAVIIIIWFGAYLAFSLDRSLGAFSSSDKLLISYTSTGTIWITVTMISVILICATQTHLFFVVKHKIELEPSKCPAPKSQEALQKPRGKAERMTLIKKCTKLTTGTIFISLWYLVTAAPYSFTIAAALCYDDIDGPSFEKWQRGCSFLMLAQQILDPIIYSVTTKEIRKGFKKEWASLKGFLRSGFCGCESADS